ncbi:benzoate 1,2-dioxygenase electron transfer component BenC [Pseudarthrobacter cellobiosi]|uniref:benzoate 1,2-dioxygenase electron transfer component BenC n=1 Tax=Pseudarthrobacter cellobiosi TaxID=2953654 RepID=UPI00208F2543|nr:MULTISPECIES: benzoate 1,2-dioxygenase electron transfer component BenC [unclassified Pseudarthrobacter]MCO4257305.1 benzoate 1,2-dioxygenase electron transfer component BenC [Pseudarthrobacter sp. HLT1-5]MCO4273771.1 benzoate 1,2-dioxygenase electron transfer component BenC [Pseudarthrobacter sp. HLT3-5]
MGHQVALSFEDGVTKVIKVGDYETVMDAAYKARINIPSDCRDGACGTCKAFCDSGSFDPGDFIDDAMTEEELEKGYMLTCQAVPESDLSIQIPATSESAKTSAATFTSTVKELNKHSESTISFTLDVQDREALAFLPGQYVNIKVPGTDAERSYSFSNGPGVDDASFMVRITPQGAMSEYLRDRAAVGDTIEFTGPYGSFFLREPKRPLLLLAGGTGLAPLLSILAKLSDNPPATPVHLIYGVTREADIVGLDWLWAFEAKLPNFTWDYIASDPGTSAPHTGYVTQIIEPAHLNDGDVDVYLCGPPPMVNAVSKWLDVENVQPANFYFERFAPKETTGGDAETGAPAPVQQIEAEGDKISRAQAISSLETGRLEFRKEDSYAHLEARMGLELAVTELMLGRLSEEQLQQFRRRAEATTRSVGAGTVQDPEEYVQTNEALHEYLFLICDNPMLLESYRRLDVHAQMAATFEKGTEIFERVTQDHLDLVEAFERRDKERARQVIMAHTREAKETMSGAIDAKMADS